MEEGRPWPSHHEVPPFSATDILFSVSVTTCVAIRTAELWFGDGNSWKGSLGSSRSQEQPAQPMPAAYPTINVHALKEKPPNPTWFPRGHEGDVASWGSQCFGEPGPPQLWSCSNETAETGAAGGLCRCSCNKCQESSSFSSHPTCRHWHSQNCIRFWVCDKRPRASRRVVPTPLQAAASPQRPGKHSVGMGNGSFTRGHGGTGQRARGAWGCANMGLGAGRHPDWEAAPGGGKSNAA